MLPDVSGRGRWWPCRDRSNDISHCFYVYLFTSLVRVTLIVTLLNKTFREPKLTTNRRTQSLDRSHRAPVGAVCGPESA